MVANGTSVVRVRVQNVLLLGIVALLALNLILPASYKLQLIRVRAVPITQAAGIDDARGKSEPIGSYVYDDEKAEEETVSSPRRSPHSDKERVEMSPPLQKEGRGGFLKSEQVLSYVYDDGQVENDTVSPSSISLEVEQEKDELLKQRLHDDERVGVLSPPLEKQEEEGRDTLLTPLLKPEKVEGSLKQRPRNDGVTVIKLTSPPSRFHRKQSDVSTSLLKLELEIEEEEREQKHGALNPDSVPGRVPLYESPAQRLRYYQSLRTKRRNRAEGQNIRSKTVIAKWRKWFENDNESVDLPSLNQYVTEDSTPVAIESELAQCTTALGVSQESMKSQLSDLKKASVKLSVFISAVKSLIPESFQPEFSSPCWYSDRITNRSSLIGILSRVFHEGSLSILPKQAVYLAQHSFDGPFERRLFCLPRFFLAGFPKSATTTLASALYKHPNVSAGVKETHWWTRAPIISPDANLLRLNVLRYLVYYKHMSRFVLQNPYYLSMDGSQSTLWDSNFVVNGRDFCTTPAAISHVLPKSKFIIVMREPSERLYSYYVWSCSNKYGNDTRNWPFNVRSDPAGNFHSEVSQIVTQFNECLQTSSLYECANHYTFTDTDQMQMHCGQIRFRLIVSIYYIHIVKFLQFFPWEQFLFLRMEDMSRDPVGIMNSVTDFLDVSQFSPTQARDVLERKYNKHHVNIEPMHEDTKQLLHTFFAPHNRRLAELLKDESFLWGYS